MVCYVRCFLFALHWKDVSNWIKIIANCLACIPSVILCTYTKTIAITATDYQIFTHVEVLLICNLTKFSYPCESPNSKRVPYHPIRWVWIRVSIEIVIKSLILKEISHHSPYFLFISCNSYLNFVYFLFVLRGRMFVLVSICVVRSIHV